MPLLSGKVAVVTGAAQGMGEAHARAFIREGARCVLTDVNTDRGERVARELGKKALFLRHDVSNDADWISVISGAEQAFGPITTLVNNAGILGPFKSIIDLTAEEFLRITAVNELGTFLGMKRTIPSMLKAGGGSIINISSTCGLRASGTPNAAYGASKYAVRGLTHLAALEYGPQNIRVNAVHPGYIETAMMTDALDEAAIAAATSKLPLRRAGGADEVANLIVFLASNQSAFITGGEHVIDGGATRP